jgi:hypothetical protein
MRLSHTQMHLNPTSLNLVIKARISVSQRSDQQEQARKNTSRIREYLQLIALPRMLISPRRIPLHWQAAKLLREQHRPER